MGYLAAGAIALSREYLESGFNTDLQTRNFWLAALGAIGGLTGLMGLMFVWATALISPPTSNRVFPVKLYTFVFWALLALAFAIWSAIIERPEPMYIWGMLGVIIFSFHMVVACSERDEWGPRVQRRIPQSQLFRIPAFLLFSGSAGGFAFSVLGSAASIAGMYLWQAMAEAKHPMRTADEELPKIAFLIAGYTYCYCMSAVLVRRMIHRTAFKSSTTWLIALIIFGAGSFLPFIAHEAFFPKKYGYNYTNNTSWLYLPSATVTIDDEIHPTRSHTEMTIIFLLFWAASITAINLSWLMRQVMKFRPPSAAKSRVDDVELDEDEDEYES
jgi:hypothetical protein